ncbi:MAG: GIY-YIG nuclease family protein [Bacteroidetes bacterium]|nr:GIY-YIG nuclease family protein [Bacteroidota bacterium]
MKEGFVYIMANFDSSVIYIGVTSDPFWRVVEHKLGSASKFTSKYKTLNLVYIERLPTISQAIEREKQLKNWKRIWKHDLIKEHNPNYDDLAEHWYDQPKRNNRSPEDPESSSG